MQDCVPPLLPDSTQARKGGFQASPLPAPTRSHPFLSLPPPQVALGITTLLTYVPVSLGAAHQGGAMVSGA